MKPSRISMASAPCRCRDHTAGGLLRLLLSAFLVTACAPDAREVREGLELTVVEACAPDGGLTRLQVRAFGDFPPLPATVMARDLPAAPFTFSDFPADTQIVIVTGEGPSALVSGSRVVAGDGRDGPLLLLPFAESCALPDRALIALPGSSVLALPGGGALVVGGLAAGVASRRVLVLGPAGQDNAELAQALTSRRYAGTATLQDAGVVVAGGGAGQSGPAHNTYELLRVVGGEVDSGGERSLCSDGGSLCPGRREHGAVALSGKELLLLGGRSSATGEPLASVVLLDSEAATVSRVGDLPTALAEPVALHLDDGTVVVLGGVDPLGEPFSGVLAYDREAGRLPEATDEQGRPLAVPQGRHPAIVALPGGRLAIVGGELDGVPSSTVTVLQRVANTPRGFRKIVLPDLLPAPLTAVRATALTDGSLLVTGLAERGSRLATRAYVVDVGTGSARELAPSSCPSCPNASQNPLALLLLADGVVAELGEQGTAFRLLELRSAFGNFPAGGLPLLDADFPGLALDASTHWDFDGVTFRAEVEGARADVSLLRFADFDSELDVVVGDAELLLVRDGQPATAVSLDRDRIAVSGCSTERLEGAVLQVERRGSELTIGSRGGPSVVCEVPGLVDRVGVGLRLSEGAALRRLSVARVAP